MDKEYRAKELRAALRFVAQKLDLTDSEKMEIAGLYRDWAASEAYTPGIIVKYGVNADNETQLWKVIQAHTSQAGWEPDKAVSLFSKIGFTDSGIAVWTQPQGAHDAYQTGDIVSHNGKTWVCTVNGNTWEPGVYGWKEGTV